MVPSSIFKVFPVPLLAEQDAGALAGQDVDTVDTTLNVPGYVPGTHGEETVDEMEARLALFGTVRNLFGFGYFQHLSMAILVLKTL